MINNINLNEIYKLDEKRLQKFYERIRKRYDELSEIEKAAKFLVSQSIGSSESEIRTILHYFQEKDFLGLNLLDFIFEWVRAQKIRLEYKRYLILQKYPKKLIKLAVDDSISQFFIRYDKYLRKTIKKSVSNHIFVLLYKIFFHDYENNNLDFNKLIDESKEQFPEGSLNNDNSINIFTLRIGLNEIIEKDYQRIEQSRTEKQKKQSFFENEKEQSKEEEDQFSFSLLEKIMKTYFINKKKVDPKEIEKGSIQLLNSYFKFGKIYAYKSFKEKLITFLAENFYESLTNEFKDLYQKEGFIELINTHLKDFGENTKNKKLGGVAWVNDLTPIITELIESIFDKLLDFNILKKKKIGKAEAKKSEINIDDIKRKVEKLEELDLEDFILLDFELDQFRSFLEDTLNETGIGIVQKRNYVRENMHEYKILLRKNKH